MRTWMFFKLCSRAPTILTAGVPRAVQAGRRGTRGWRNGDARNCPVCDRALNQTDDLLLRGSEHFRCHDCGHDLVKSPFGHSGYA